MRFKLQPGTSTSLCRTCSYGRVTTRANWDEQATCGADTAYSIPVPLDIVRCTSYDARNQTSKFDMEKVAWEVRHDRSGRIVGFTPPKKRE